MMNKDYWIYGKIISAINKDCPHRVSKNFSESVMSKIYDNKKTSVKYIPNNFVNIAASVLIAVTTSLLLINYESDEYETVSGETSQPSQIQDSLIKRVIDDESCNNNELKKSDTVNQNECK